MRLFQTDYTASVSHYMIINPGVYNLVVDACFDTDLYESSQEQRPSVDLIVNTARMLRVAPMENVAIAPFFGEIDVTWKGDNRRVKAIFGPQPDSLSIYREQMANGRVTLNELTQNAGHADLCTSVGWLNLPACAMQPQMA